MRNLLRKSLMGRFARSSSLEPTHNSPQSRPWGIMGRFQLVPAIRRERKNRPRDASPRHDPHNPTGAEGFESSAAPRILLVAVRFP
jgi:hypothetical protein